MQKNLNRNDCLRFIFQHSWRYVLNHLVVGSSLDSGLKFMVLNATFIKISVILWRSILLVEETVVP